MPKYTGNAPFNVDPQRATYRKASRMQLLVVLLLASVIFFSSALLAGALLLRGQWDKMASRDDSSSGTDAKTR